MAYKRSGPRRPHQLDWGALRRHVDDHPDRIQAERARHFQVSRYYIWNALRKLVVPHKKRRRYHGRGPLQRKRFLRRGKQPVYINEYGFLSSSTRRQGYAPKDQRVDGLVSGYRRPRTSLIAARMDGRLEEPYLFDGTYDTALFNAWLKTRLCPRLNAHHLVIMDNAVFHTSPETAQLIETTGATLLFLSSNSPDFNPINHDFAVLKKRREYQKTASLDEIIKAYQ
ncbi:transposase [Candidatus Nitrospira nitrosa]|uniref:Transposase n=1 Tax=Candidatus Nitrospira nitrosa TaxID=1742972 RepID=A0A0S4L1U8_9BACT|nr:transposase [Candidatus Nitrospira nitrosa]CUS31660.1 transposase [Candidatus Nitrospira nitrosa]